jgi:signal transduction histidine kinase
VKRATTDWGAALLAVALATGLTEASFALGAELTFEWYVAAVALVAWWFGRAPALGAALLSSALVDFVFFPLHGFSIGLGLVDAGRVLVFLGLAALVAHLVAARTVAEDERRNRERLLAQVAHELGNMLLALRTWTAAIHRRPLAREQFERAAAALERTAAAVGQLVGDLLDWSRIALGQLDIQREEVDLAEVAKDAIEAIQSRAEQGGVAVASSLSPTIVHADRRRLQQVVLNLLTNSLRATTRGDEVVVSVSAANRRAILSVTDTGRGIERERLARLFDNGARANGSEGLGLGLTVSRDLVRAQGGEITVRSGGAGTGATFSVELPVACG